ncbi:predicted protein [Naegleria gruberi]|uniref:Dolichol-phosphate mannosyltransferase subunit 1 n=1 Tax=Naegleria gruberi TaxID=5762 RepID=D2V2D2_NAEGR|nr:uncharacterized protein NAEGRDRAFT_82455 [Naegleria gruberi]EFC49037.1 predicted protein [Naegleria gruberi]|eukprot:XP_002681781.1 predicted protein [Naegleria gruberi strain NEG-M]
MSSSSVLVTIVIPAFKEAANLKELVTRIYDAVETQEIKTLDQQKLIRSNTEVIVVDDNSKDGSDDIINELAKDKTKYPNLRIIVRTNEKGLSSAVLRGFDEGKGQYLMCMDADLQHPPEDVPKMFQYLFKDNAVEFVLGTRYGSGSMSVDSNWPLYRQIISKGARSLARPLTPLSDPMSGFFALPKSVYQRALLNSVNPIGFKIALELYAKAGVKKHAEHAFAFGVRLHGFSKLSGKVIVHYLKHLYDLYQFKYPYMLHLAAIIILLFVFYILRLIFSK